MPKLPSKNHFVRTIKTNTLLGLILAFSASLFYPSITLAQTSAENGHSLSATDIVISKTDFNSGETISGQLLVKNSSNKTSSDWIYRASITKDSEMGPGDIINSVFYKKTLSIGGNKETKLNFSIPVLKTLPTGVYGLEVELLTASVANPGPFFYKKINVSGSGEGFLTVNKLALLANDKEEPPTVGLPHKPEDSLKARIEVENKSSKEVVAKPEFNIYIRQSHKEPFNKVSTENVTVNANSTKTIDLDIPNLPPGNSYWGEVIFKSGNEQIAQIAPFRIVLSGVSAKIISVSTDKNYYQKGENVQVLVEYTGPVEDEPKTDLGNGKVVVKVKSGFTTIGEGETTIDLNQAGLAVVNLKAGSGFNNSEIDVSILQGVQVLDQFTSKQAGGNSLENLLLNYLIYIVAAVGFLIFLFALFMVRKSRKLVVLLLAFGLVGVATFGGFRVKQVFANHCFISCSQQQTDISDRTTGHGANPLRHEWNGPSRDSLWRPGQRPNFGGRMWQDGCGNTFGAAAFGLPNRTQFRIQYNTLAWNVQGGDLLGTVTDNSGNARSSVGWFWNGWSVPNNIPQKEALLQAVPEGYNLQGSPQHYDRLLLSERVFFGPAAPNSLAVSGQPACSSGPYSQVTFTWGQVAPQITDGFWVDVSESSSFTSFSNKQVGSCAFCSTTGVGGWNGPLASGGNLQLQPGRTYYFRVYAYNDKPGSGIYSGVRSFNSAPVCGITPPPPVGPPPPPPVGGPPPPPPTSPNLTVIFSSFLPTTPVATDNMTFRGTVRNTGSISSVASQTRLRIDIGNNGTYDVTVSPNQSTGSLAPGLNETETWTNSWPAQAGTHRFEICADVTNTNPSEVSESDNCRITNFNVAPARPNYQVSSIGAVDPITLNPLATVVAGQNISFRASVVNNGAVNVAAAPTGGDGRFCDFDPIVNDNTARTLCYAVSPPATLVGVDFGLQAIPFGSSVNEISNGSKAFANDRRIVFCADTQEFGQPSGRVAEVTDTAQDNCFVWDLTVLPNNSWLQTNGGNVGNKNEIRHPSIGNDHSQYLVLTQAITGAFNSAKNWVLTSYDPVNTIGTSYDDFKNEFDTGASSISGSDLPVGSGTYISSGTFNWSGGFSGAPCSATNQSGSLIFISGDLNVASGTNSKAAPANCQVVIVVRNNVNVAAQITRIDATIISFGQFVTSSNGPGDPQLILNGSVLSSLDAVADGPLFQRILSDNTPPAELIHYQPEVLWYLATKLGRSGTQYFEVNP